MFWAVGIGCSEQTTKEWFNDLGRLISLRDWAQTEIAISDCCSGTIIGPQTLLPEGHKINSFTQFCGDGFVVDDGKVCHLPKIISNQYDEEFVRDLRSRNVNGQYSAIASEGDKFTVFADVYGLKPVYYYQVGGAIFLSSDIRAILVSPAFEITPSHRTIVQSLNSARSAEDIDDGKFTCYEGILKLRMLETLEISASNRKITSSFVQFPKLEITSRSFDENVKHLEHLLGNFVQPLVRECPNKSVFDLSGGVDSATVLGAALDGDLSGKLHTSSLVFKDQAVHFADDTALIQEFKTDAKLDGDCIYSEDTMSQNEVHPPFLGPNTVANYQWVLQTQSTAGKLGSYYHFGGEGADFHYSGLLLYQDYLNKCGRWEDSKNMVLGWRKNSNSKSVIIANLLEPISYLHNWVYRRLFWPSLPYSDKIWSKSWLTKKGISAVNDLRDEPLPRSFRKFRNSLKYWYRWYQFDMLFPRSSYLDLLGHMPVAIVAPYLNKDLVQFAFQLPPDALIDEKNADFANEYAGTKRILRSLYKRHIPDNIANKRVKSVYNEMAISELLQNADAIERNFTSNAKFSLVSSGLVNISNLMKVFNRITLLANFSSTTLGTDYVQLRRIWKLQEWLNYISDPDLVKKSCFSTHNDGDDNWIMNNKI